MKIDLVEVEGCVLVSVDSSVLQEHIPMLKDRLEALIMEDKYNIILDMSDAMYLSSMGLSVILKIKNQANSRGGDVKLISVNKLIMHLLEITNLSKKFDIFDSVEKAVDLYRSGK